MGCGLNDGATVEIVGNGCHYFNASTMYLYLTAARIISLQLYVANSNG